ncbi:unnamed protein product, partial [Cyprideis torosa]
MSDAWWPTGTEFCLCPCPRSIREQQVGWQAGQRWPSPRLRASPKPPAAASPVGAAPREVSPKPPIDILGSSPGTTSGLRPLVPAKKPDVAPAASPEPQGAEGGSGSAEERLDILIKSLAKEPTVIGANASKRTSLDTSGESEEGLAGAKGKQMSQSGHERRERRGTGGGQ